MLAAITTAVVLLVWARLHRPVSSDYDRYHNQIFTCVKVVDGDTIDIDIPDRQYKTTRVRLWGVDTPETAHSRTGEMYYGPEASAFAKSLVLGKHVRLVLVADKTRGKYGRLLAYVYLEGTDTLFNEELIAQGYGYADRRFPHPWKQRFSDLEKRAQKKQLGLWEEVTYEQFPPWRQRYEKWREAKRENKVED